MKLFRKVAILGALMVPVATVPASAQSWKWDWNINAGYSFFNEILEGVDAGMTAGENKDVKFKSGGLLGTQLTFWPSSRIGIRANGTYADRPLVTDDWTISSPAGSGIENINLWSASGDLLFRFAKPDDEFEGMEILPYIAVGLGAKWHNGAGDNYTCVDTDGEGSACTPFTLTGGTAPGNNFALAEASTLMGLVGFGADWRFARSVALRTEIGDRIWDPRLQRVVVPATGTIYTLGDGDEDMGSTIHEFYGQVGLSFLFGVDRPEVVAVVAPPAPVEPAPVTPTVSREAMSVCVVDPTAPNGLRMQDAYLVGGRDTVVVAGGSDRPFSTSIGNVSTAANADWYVRGQPLTIRTGATSLEYASYGSARIIESGDLAYVGMVNGMPVYADRNEVADINDELMELRRTRPGTDLGVLLAENRVLRDEIDDVQVLYVPMSPSGCVFQAVQIQEQVRKGK
jgi:hypothetical protein